MPSYASTSVGVWTAFDADVIARELDYAKRLRLNSVRMYLQYVAYEANPKQFVKDVKRFVELADARGIRPLFVLFDSCFGKEPSLDEANSAIWVNNPGFSRITAKEWSQLEAYVGDVVGTFKDDPRVLMWDVMNEPMADFDHVTREERDLIWKFCRHFCKFAKSKDANHPITVGHAVVEYIPRTADLVDVLSIHSYARYSHWLQEDIELAQRYGKEFRKPVIVSEFGNPGAGQPYEMGLDVIEKNRLGFYFWELMISKVMFKEMAGLLYPDGTARDLGPVARLLAGQAKAGSGRTEGASVFQRKRVGGIPQKQPPQHHAERNLRSNPTQWRPFVARVSAAARTKANIQGSLVGLATIGRHLMRPRPQAQRVFELALSIPHHYRLGRNDQAVQDFEELLGLVSRAVRKVDAPKKAAGE